MTTYAGDDVYEARHGASFATDKQGYRVLINQGGRTVEVSILDLAEFMAEEAPDQMARRIGIDGVYKPGKVDDVNLPSTRATALLRALVLELKGQGDQEFRKAVRGLLDWSPQLTPLFQWEEDPDVEGLPFFCESYLYPLLGKDDARSLLARMRPIWEAAGIPRKEQP